MGKLGSLRNQARCQLRRLEREMREVRREMEEVAALLRDVEPASPGPGDVPAASLPRPAGASPVAAGCEGALIALAKISEGIPAVTPPRMFRPGRGSPSQLFADETLQAQGKGPEAHEKIGQMNWSPTGFRPGRLSQLFADETHQTPGASPEADEKIGQMNWSPALMSTPPRASRRPKYHGQEVVTFPSIPHTPYLGIF